MAKGMLAATACLLMLACGPADPTSEEPVAEPETSDEGWPRALPPGSHGEYDDSSAFRMPFGWTNNSCPGPACDPPYDRDDLVNPAPNGPDPMVDPAPSALPPETQ